MSVCCGGGRVEGLEGRKSFARDLKYSSIAWQGSKVLGEIHEVPRSLEG